MKHFCYYFSEEKVLHALVKKRVDLSSKRHELIFLDNIRHQQNRKFGQTKSTLVQIFPPRNTWVRLIPERRAAYINDTVKGLCKELYTTVLKARKEADRTSIMPTWLKKLNDLIFGIRKSMMEPLTLTTIKPSGFKYKSKNKVAKEYRVLAKYTLKDNIIASLVTGYLTDHTDTVMGRPYFSENSYAFRSSRVTKNGGSLYSYHLAARKIEEYRIKNIKKGIYVAEVDLAKFYDTVNHSVLKTCLDKMAAHFDSSGKPIDPRALKIARNYLDSFSFNIDALPKQVKDRRYFKWPEKQLEGLGVNILEDRIGIAQGGALSCFFANLILHDLDSVFPAEDKNLAYLRYCDDFIVLHTDEQKCKEYVDSALSKIRALKLVAHSPDDYELSDYKKRITAGSGKKNVNEFWNSSKSKNPYRWGPYDSQHKMNVPYVSFVGYQRRYDGLLRVRKNSLRKEYAKQKQLGNKIIGRVRSKRHGEIKLNRRQIMFRAEQKLIAMSVGKKHIKNYDKKLGLCWSNGFRVIGEDPKRSNGQLKYLDRSREQHLRWLRKKLKEIYPENKGGSPNDGIKKLHKPMTSYYAYFNLAPKKERPS